MELKMSQNLNQKKLETTNNENINNISYNVKNYKFNDINLPQIEYIAEIDGEAFPDRNQHLKKKEQILEEYQLIKKSKIVNRVRR
jgi:hypothetical protein